MLLNFQPAEDSHCYKNKFYDSMNVFLFCHHNHSPCGGVYLISFFLLLFPSYFSHYFCTGQFIFVTMYHNENGKKMEVNGKRGKKGETKGWQIKRKLFISFTWERAKEKK